jgi:autonomous glycyl radical cofactor GrcA
MGGRFDELVFDVGEASVREVVVAVAPEVEVEGLEASQQGCQIFLVQYTKTGKNTPNHHKI